VKRKPASTRNVNGSQGVVRLEAGSCVHLPPGIRHRELGNSDDIEMLEVVMSAGFATEEVPAGDG
jgi:quercetin dioxygenase-like cupin family protein